MVPSLQSLSRPVQLCCSVASHFSRRVVGGFDGKFSGRHDRRMRSLLILFAAVTAACAAEESLVFRRVIRKQGDDGVHTYRIPGLATSTKGTLLAVFDIRNKRAGDLPADIDVGL